MLLSVGVSLATASSFSGSNKTTVLSPAVAKGLAATGQQAGNGNGEVIVAQSVKNDTSPRLGNITPKPVTPSPNHPAQPNPPIVHRHTNRTDPVVQDSPAAPKMPGTLLNFDGIPFPGVNCNCAPPDTNGEVGSTQYVQIVNEGIEVWDKITGNSIFGPVGITTLWSGFGGPCENAGRGDPVVVYDQFANRWIVSQFAIGSAGIPESECVAVSTSDDATGSYNRYAFDLGTGFGVNFYDYPKLSVWPDAYYMSMNVFNSSGTAFLGPQPFAMDRSAMLNGTPAAIISTGMLSPSDDQLMPADVDGMNQPPSGAPNPFTEIGTNPTWKVWRFHVDFGQPNLSTFTLAGNIIPAPFSVICGGGSCVPQAGTGDTLDTLGDRSMFRNAYRRFTDGHEALIGDMTVESNGVAGVRWYEINNATSGSPSSSSRAPTSPTTRGAGWEAPRWTHSVTSPSASARRPPASIRRSATRGGWPAIRRTRWRRAKQRSSRAPAVRPTRSAAGATTRTSRSTPTTTARSGTRRSIRDDQFVQLEDADRELQVHELRSRAARHARGHGNEREQQRPGRRRQGGHVVR